ncbi:MAG: ABC transporter ATP-binding protein [Chloroflexi bacterium]|nr:MAG: ABC transporter ATP-binding protein [Chloroflexota bacterium]
MDAKHFPLEQQREQIDLTLPVEPQPERANQTLPAVTVIAEGLSKYFRSAGETIKAVDEVSFAFTAGQFVAVLGPSGCGKSTLLYLLGGLDRPSAGELMIDGVNVKRLSARQEHRFRRQKLGFVFQSFHLIASLTALENVMLPIELMGGTSGAAMHERARVLLKQVGINDDRHNHKPGKLSGGQQQRVAIARALANDPRVILADEPTGNLDSRTGKPIIQLLKQLAQQGRTVIVVTHDRSITEVADVRMEMMDGRIETMENYVPPVNNRLLLEKKGHKR